VFDTAADSATSVEVQSEVGAWIPSINPAIDLGAIGAQCGGNGLFGRGAIGPGGGCGDVAFTTEAFAKLVVGAANMLLQGVAAALFVAC
jgi:hypothetical protein